MTKAYQLTIPAENKPGVLAQITSALAKAKVNIRAATISSFGATGFFNLIVDDPEQGHKALSKAGICVNLTEVIAVLINDQPGGLDKLVQRLAAQNVNIENAYGFVIESHKQAVFVLEVKEPDKTKEIIKKAGFETLTSQALSEIEPFHYMKY